MIYGAAQILVHRTLILIETLILLFLIYLRFKLIIFLPPDIAKDKTKQLKGQRGDLTNNECEDIVKPAICFGCILVKTVYRAFKDGYGASK